MARTIYNSIWKFTIPSGLAPKNGKFLFITKPEFEKLELLCSTENQSQNSSTAIASCSQPHLVALVLNACCCG